MADIGEGAGPRRDWIAEGRPHDMTVACERGLRAASNTLWLRLHCLAWGEIQELAVDYFGPMRPAIAAYLRATGREDEAAQVGAIGCNEAPPRRGFLTAQQRADLRDVLGGEDA